MEYPAAKKIKIYVQLHPTIADSQLSDVIQVAKNYLLRKPLTFDAGKGGNAILVDLTNFTLGLGTKVVLEEFTRVYQALKRARLQNKGVGWEACMIDVLYGTCTKATCTGFHPNAIGSLPLIDGSLQLLASHVCIMLEKFGQKDHPKLRYVDWSKLSQRPATNFTVVEDCLSISAMPQD